MFCVVRMTTLTNNQGMKTETSQTDFIRSKTEYLVSRAGLVCALAGVFIAIYVFSEWQMSSPWLVAPFVGLACALGFFLVAISGIAVVALYQQSSSKIGPVRPKAADPS